MFVGSIPIIFYNSNKILAKTNLEMVFSFNLLPAICKNGSVYPRNCSPFLVFRTKFNAKLHKYMMIHCLAKVKLSSFNRNNFSAQCNVVYNIHKHKHKHIQYMWNLFSICWIWKHLYCIWVKLLRLSHLFETTSFRYLNDL